VINNDKNRLRNKRYLLRKKVGAMTLMLNAWAMLNAHSYTQQKLSSGEFQKEWNNDKQWQKQIQKQKISFHKKLAYDFNADGMSNTTSTFTPLTTVA